MPEKRRLEEKRENGDIEEPSYMLYQSERRERERESCNLTLRGTCHKLWQNGDFVCSKLQANRK